MANDFYSYDNEDNNSYKKTVALCIAAASLVVLGFLMVLYVNTQKKIEKVKAEAAQEAVEYEASEEDDILAGSHNFTSDELDFWKDADKGTPDKKPKITPTPDDDVLADTDEDDDTDTADNDDADSDKDSTDGEEIPSVDKLSDYSEEDRENHIAIKDDKGNVKYYEIIPSVPKNHYDFEKNLVDKDGVLSYKDGTVEAVLGIDLSKYNGTVDWKSVSDSGVSFAMLRLGSRGYGTGEIVLDEKFVDYAQNANLNNIAIGAYFYSQAINESEAVEEANYIVGAVASFNVKYPIAIDVEEVTGDEARTDKLTAKERTAIVKSFCDTVKTYGYKPIIYADRKMLVTGLNLEELTDYDIWLADDKVPTDFPYNYSIWQYSKLGRVNGIVGDVDLNMSFVHYEQR